MNCEKCRNLIENIDTLDVSSSIRIELEGHLKGCRACAEYRFNRDQTSDLLVRALSDDEIEASDRFEVMFRARLEQAEKTGALDAPRPPMRLSKKTITSAAAATVIVTLTIVLLIKSPPQKIEVERTAETVAAGTVEARHARPDFRVDAAIDENRAEIIPLLDAERSRLRFYTFTRTVVPAK